MKKDGKRDQGRVAVFLDRDGTLNAEVGYLDTLNKLTILPGAVEAVRLINQAGFLAIVVTNQSGIARGFFDEIFVRDIHEHIRAIFQNQDARIDGFYYCPHHPTEGKPPYLVSCPCRKPAPGMLLRAAEEWGIDLDRSYMIGDTPKDVETAQRAGGKGIIVRTGHFRDEDLDIIHPDHVADDVLAAVRWIVEQR